MIRTWKSLILIVAVLSACQSKKQLTEEELIEMAAAPLMANEVGDFMLVVKDAQDSTLEPVQRALSMDKLCKEYPEYMCTIPRIEATNQEPAAKGETDFQKMERGFRNGYKNSIATSNSAGFNQHVDLQKKLIEDRCRKFAKNQLYKKQLEERYQSKSN